jgi:hypothetical protein
MLISRRFAPLMLACLLALLPALGLLGPAQAVVGAYVEVHELGCPPGYDPGSLFHDCHGNRLSGVAMVADGPGGRHYADATDAEGRVVFGDFLEAGPVTISESQMAGDYVDYVVFCSRVDNQQPIAAEKHTNGRAAFVVALPQDIVDAGSGIICDWYNLPEPLGAQTPQPGATQAGGIGLTRAGWTERHGTPTRAGDILTFEDGAYAVAFDRDVATFVEVTLDGGQAMEDARAIAVGLLPNDAELSARYTLPATPGGPIPMLVEQYQSETLAAALTHAGVGGDGDGGILVVYQFAPSPENATPADAPVARISIAAGVAPAADPPA